MSCCSNSCCQTSVKLLATFALQRTTRAQEHCRAAATQDSGLHTRRVGGVASQQTRPQFVDELRLLIKWHISQGMVETPIRRGGQLCCSSVANLLQYLYAKNYQNTMWFDKVIAKNRRVHFFAPRCIFTPPWRGTVYVACISLFMTLFINRITETRYRCRDEAHSVDGQCFCDLAVKFWSSWHLLSFWVTLT